MSRMTNCPRCGQMRLDNVVHICLKTEKDYSATTAAARADSFVSTGGGATTASEFVAELRGAHKAFAEIERALLGIEPLDPNHHTAQVLAQHDEKIRSEAYAKGYTDGSRDYDR